VSSYSLLLIDADPAVHELLTGMLRRDDRRLECTFDGGEALEMLRKTAFDVVIAGQGRNGYDGLKLVKKVRAVQPDARVIVTGRQDPQRVVGAIRERAYGYIHQPLDQSPLSEVVMLALDSRGWQDDIRVVSARPEWFTAEVRCKLDAAERITHFLRELTTDLPAQVREDIAVAFRELLMNAIEHGGKSDPMKRVRASLLRTSKSLIVHMQDPGKGFSLDLLPHAAISNPADSPIRHVEIRAEEGRRPGGFGILMTRNLVDELLYNERGNAVLFIKYL
jgi:DNA-binding NarL/FixJ family response regulator